MQNQSTSARTAAKTTFKSSLLFRPAPLAAILMLAAVLFVGCVNDAKESVQNGDFKVEFLFEQNGCKMYRFKDGGTYVYWSDCQGKVQYDYSTQSGKSRVTHKMETVTSGVDSSFIVPLPNSR